jgi:hypothetical protein
MCLACELDALWYAEWDRLAAEGATAARTAGAPPALADDAAGAERGALAESEETAAAAASPSSSLKDDAGPAAPRSGFRCEETE